MSRKAKLLGCLLALGALGSGAPSFAKKAKKGAARAAGIEYARVLEAHADEVGRCAADELGGEVKAVDLKANMLIDNQGRAEPNVTVKPAFEGAQKIRACVDRVLRGVAFPKGKDSAVTLTKTWHFAVQ